ncbi:hypothetical protein CDD82_3381 [Ophiocordyceps australis]|uniref:ribonuclease Z n=1 Tax=Ophiocordyceps australis TaxID=1399860 RepID=A0A2C5ZEX3_9HYPO|nr:hypothetical protein CDD82_3381 [Ophiocordyceps australis]
MEKWGSRRLKTSSIVAGLKASHRHHHYYLPRLQDTAHMSTTVEIATVPSADTPGTCLYMHHERCTYIFGRVAEGTQRAFGTRKLGLPNTSQIFLSGPVQWDQMGGLLGYILTVGGAYEGANEGRNIENEKRLMTGRKQLKPIVHGGLGLHGGENLCHSLAACRHIIFRHSISLKVHEHRTDPRAESPTQLDPDWSDESIRVWKIPVRKACANSPPKRPHGAIDDDGGQETAYKSGPTLSDPDVASLIVERVMFSGSKESQSGKIIPCTVNDLRPGDAAFVMRNSTLASYKGPYPSGQQGEVEGGKEPAWRFPRSDKEAQAYDEVDEDEDDEGVDAHVVKNHLLPPTSQSQTCMSYIVKCQQRRGKFNVAAAKELGVAMVDFKQLTHGMSVTGKDGMTVTPDMVLGKPVAGRGIVVADVPSADWVDAFLQRPEWQQASLMEDLVAMYWIMGPGVASDARIGAFVQQHGQLKHVFCAPETCPNMTTHTGAAEMQVRLRQIDAQRFPLVDFDNTVQYRSDWPRAGGAL